MQVKEIDGSVLEGGGQILRNTCSYAALLRQPINITKVRNARKPPGLRAQHATGIQLIGGISKCSILTGAEQGSATVGFTPGLIEPGHYTADPGTAGSTTLLLQISLPCLFFPPQGTDYPSTLTLKGGTNATMAPQIDYTEHIFLPFLKRHFGLAVDLKVNKRGYYPKGGGEVTIRVNPAKYPLPCVTLLERGKLLKIKGKAYVAGLPAVIARTIRDTAVEGILSALSSSSSSPSTPEGSLSNLIEAEDIQIDAIREQPQDAVGAGSGIVLWAETESGCRIGGSSVGRKGVDSGQTAREAVKELVRGLKDGGCVDEYLQDQMLIFLALAKGTSKVSCGPLTLHTKTAIWIAEQMTGAKFTVTEEEGRTIIECTGIGYEPPAAPNDAEAL